MYVYTYVRALYIYIASASYSASIIKRPDPWKLI